MAAIIVIEGEFWTSETGHSVSKSEFFLVFLMVSTILHLGLHQFT